MPAANVPAKTERERRKNTNVDLPPNLDFYRNTSDRTDRQNQRPTIQELSANKLLSPGFGGSHPCTAPKETGKKFGWIEGVFVRCVQNIIGVILYLRLTWVVAQAGVGKLYSIIMVSGQFHKVLFSLIQFTESELVSVMGVAIIFLAAFVTVLTAISTSTICTNGEMKGGGLYYLISRTLGAEYGGSIGLLFSLANCVGGGLYIVGFAETVKQLLVESGITILDGDVWDIRVLSVGKTTLLLLFVRRH
ncbi:unnamed protein product [Heligmosomoides polygyrus]|uniref:AA_permease domain-containing protein n=1 Tax=Heligmosomoides polygyrus TaxID=6339 RepID=A0A183FZ48_HELPZ|nr:unnamed protein product [Heligmosomoides polygyrus]